MEITIDVIEEVGNRGTLEDVADLLDIAFAHFDTKDVVNKILNQIDVEEFVEVAKEILKDNDQWEEPREAIKEIIDYEN